MAVATKGMSLFSMDEIRLLKESGKMPTEEITALAIGSNITLETVVRARRILDYLRIASSMDIESLATKTEVNLLIDEINKAMVKLFLIFKLLEKKGLVTEAELLDLSLSFEDKGDENGTQEKIPSPTRGGKARRGTQKKG